jgi:hypothetical protein
MRLQQVEIYIEIPVNKIVKINNEIIRLGVDSLKVDNVNEDYEENGHIESDGSYSHWN